jgi:nucleoside-diphosphate-sugar epimerase
MKAIITGATGFLGRHLVDYLIDKQWNIIALGRNLSMAEKLAKQHVQFKSVDLCDATAVMQTFESADVVFHCAALSSVWGDYVDFYNANVEATRHILNACLHHGVKRLVYVSSPSIYFDYQDKFNIKETDSLPSRFVNAYAETKFLGETLVMQARHQLEVVIIRPRGLFGEYDTSIMPRIIKIATKGIFPTFKKTGNMADLTYVKNVAHSLYLAATVHCAIGQIYNITNGEPVTLEKVIQTILSQLDMPVRWKNLPRGLALNTASAIEWGYRWCSKKEPPMTRYSIGILAFSQTLCLDKARNELGYTPIFSINEGIERYVEWYKSI